MGCVHSNKVMSFLLILSVCSHSLTFPPLWLPHILATSQSSQPAYAHSLCLNCSPAWTKLWRPRHLKGETQREGWSKGDKEGCEFPLKPHTMSSSICWGWSTPCSSRLMRACRLEHLDLFLSLSTGSGWFDWHAWNEVLGCLFAFPFVSLWRSIRKDPTGDLMAEANPDCDYFLTDTQNVRALTAALHPNHSSQTSSWKSCFWYLDLHLQDVFVPLQSAHPTG